MNGVHDEVIPVPNSYRLSENLANAVLLTYPDAGHGALFQYHESFTRQASVFLASDSPFAPVLRDRRLQLFDRHLCRSNRGRRAASMMRSRRSSR